MAVTRSLVSLVMVSLCSGILGFSQEKKSSVEELLIQHLASVGSAEALSRRESTVCEGTVILRFLVRGSGALDGKALFYSQGRKYRLFLDFGRPSYQREEIVFDGKDFLVAPATPAARSPLGEFLFVHNELVKEGLLGGVLSTAWPLFDTKGRKAKLRYEGLDEEGEEDFHEVRYEAGKVGRDVRVRILLEPETGRHRKTIYTFATLASMNPTARQIGDAGTDYRLEEWFSDFASEGGLTLPRIWTIRYSISGSQGLLWEWEVHFGGSPL